LHERLKALRKALGLNQTEFGNRISVPQTSLSRWESGVNTPADSTIALICREFGVSEAWLRQGSGPMFRAQSADEELAEWFGELLSGGGSLAARILVDAIRRTPPEALEDFLTAVNAAMDDWEAKNSPAD